MVDFILRLKGRTMIRFRSRSNADQQLSNFIYSPFKHASNVFRIKESRAEVRQKFKNASWWQKFLCCQNIDIRHGQYDMYEGQRQIRKDIKASQGEPPVLSDKALFYNTWSKGRVNWEDFEVV